MWVSLPGFVLLEFLVCGVAVVNADSGINLSRQRREWILPPRPLKENVDYTKEEYIGKIRSHFESETDILYSLEGIGASENPYNVFIVNPKSGLIRVTQVLDREFIDTYNLSGIAKYSDGRQAEKKIDIKIKVVDENDNAPVFGFIKAEEVNELSPIGTVVMKVTATDADEPGSPNSQIAYSIVSQSPSDDMFYMNKDGTIYVQKPFLDREKEDQYILTVKGQDLNGNPGGNSGTSTVIINVLDVNDNLPTLEKEEYEASIEENTHGVEVMRLKAEDLDLKDTENWEAVFDIIKGNEAGYFSIRTDPKTNEGILMLDKPVDYEDVKNLELGLAVRNKAPLSSVTGPGPSFKTYPVKINVKNQPEGPSFDPAVKVISISEGGHSFSIEEIITHYTAVDRDTGKPAENVKYVKGSDPDNWLTIDPETAEIKLNKMPDRESTFLVNGTYFAKVLCISEDMPSKTATGTVAIQVEDFNDHCPTLTTNFKTMCTPSDAVIVNAKDEDAYPNGPPFHFSIIPEGTEGKWKAEHLNDTATILRAEEPLWPGYYEVELLVTDALGEACPEPQKVKVQVCTCEDGVICGKKGANGQTSKSAALGPAGIGLLFLGLLLLLLIPLLLLFCQCGGSGGLPGGGAEIPFDTKSHLINYHTEGKGENTEVPLINLPTQVDWGADKNMSHNSEVKKHIYRLNRAGYEDFYEGQMKQTWRRKTCSDFSSGFESRRVEASSGAVGIYENMALPRYFLRQYYHQKVGSGMENPAVTDSLLVYDFEGQGSPAGSVGSCSLIESNNDLEFLSDLGPKFKTLAEVCGGKTIPSEVQPVPTLLPTASITTRTSISDVKAPQPKLQPEISRTEKTSERSDMVKTTLREEMSTVKEGVTNQGQMFMLQQQQPVYYTTTPVMQPMHYVVQPQVQNTMLLAEAPVTNLQGMVLVNGTQTGPAQGMVVQGQTVMAGGEDQGPGMVLLNSGQTGSAQGMVVQGQTLMSGGQAQGPGLVLVERSTVKGSNKNLIQAGNLSGSQTRMAIESKVPTGSLKALRGSKTSITQQGTLQPGWLSGSRRSPVVEGSAANGGKVVQKAGSLHQKSNVSDSQRVHISKGSMSTGSQSRLVVSSATKMSTKSTNHKLMVHGTRK